MHNIKTIAINDLINQDSGIQHYIIPDYQRGYRWDKTQVRALLKDIHDFMHKSKDDNEKYCLQPIVVAEAEYDNKAVKEVIDGQQRLTTLFLLLSCLEVRKNYRISFEKRGQSNDFLRNLVENGKTDDSNPDFYFMSQAYTIIKQWFADHASDTKYRMKYLLVLLEQVQVIYYNVATQSKQENIEIFERLNIGKIPLNDAELLKALLLNKVKYGLSDREGQMEQLRIASEWQNMEYELQKEAVWGFLNNPQRKVGKQTKAYDARIELLFDLAAETTEKSEYTTFSYFERAITLDQSEKLRTAEEQALQAQEEWRKVKAVFAQLLSWQNTYAKAEVYHYVGYLLHLGAVKLTDLLDAAKDKSKSAFLAYLKNEVKRTMANVKIEDLGYDGYKADCHKTLLLFNVLTACQKTKGTDNRFPFYRFATAGTWSLEHIHAQKELKMREAKAVIQWCKDTLAFLEDLGDSLPIVDSESGQETTQTEDVKSYIVRLQQVIEGKHIDFVAFDKLYDELTECFGVAVEHGIQNLALLDKDLNASLNNALFPVKRKKMIEAEMRGGYIPDCTKNVFLKFYSQAVKQPYYWSKADQEAYLKAIETTLKPFLND